MFELLFIFRISISSAGYECSCSACVAPQVPLLAQPQPGSARSCMKPLPCVPRARQETHFRATVAIARLWVHVRAEFLFLKVFRHAAVADTACCMCIPAVSGSSASDTVRKSMNAGTRARPSVRKHQRFLEASQCLVRAQNCRKAVRRTTCASSKRSLSAASDDESKCSPTLKV